MSARFVAAVLAMGRLADELADVIGAVIVGPPSRAVARRDFELPGPVALERGDVARLLGDRGVKPDNVRPGLVPCVTCGSLQAPRAEGGQLGVHYPTLADVRPCPGSWPTKVQR